MKAIVIGSGIGGTGSAALLASEGYEVIVLEKNSFIGGRCSSTVRDGIIVDNFAHIFPIGIKGPIGRIAKRVGADIEFIRHDPGAMLYDDRDGKLRKYPQPLDMNPPLTQLKMALNLGVKLRKMPSAGILFRKLLAADDAFCLENDDRKLVDFISRYTNDEQVHRFINVFCYMMFTISYTEASAGEFIYCFREMFKASDISYPKGSAGAITAAFAEAVENMGGEVRRSCEAKGVVCDNGRVRGVETESGFLEADLVLSNAGIDITADLAGEDAMGKDYMEYAGRLRYSGAGVVAKYLIDGIVADYPAVIYMPEADAANMFSFIEEGGTPSDLMMMMPVVDRLDPGSVPAGKQLIIAATPGKPEPLNDSSEPLLKALERQLFELFPDMKNSIIWKESVKPEHISAVTGRKKRGESVGVAQIPGQVGKSRPSPLTPVNGLYNVGVDAGARGIGTWMAAASAEHVANLVKTKHRI